MDDPRVSECGSRVEPVAAPGVAGDPRGDQAPASPVADSLGNVCCSARASADPEESQGVKKTMPYLMERGGGRFREADGGGWHGWNGSCIAVWLGACMRRDIVPSDWPATRRRTGNA